MVLLLFLNSKFRWPHFRSNWHQTVYRLNRTQTQWMCIFFTKKLFDMYNTFFFCFCTISEIYQLPIYYTVRHKKSMWERNCENGNWKLRVKKKNCYKEKKTTILVSLPFFFCHYFLLFFLTTVSQVRCFQMMDTTDADNIDISGGNTGDDVYCIKMM